MKKNDFLQSMIEEAQDIYIPELSEDLNAYPITVVPIEVRATKKKKKSPLSAIFLTLILVMGLGFFYSVYTKEETLLTIDINPSIELKINSFDRVIGVKAYNADGEKFVEGLNINNCTIDEAIQKVVLKAYEDNYITPQCINSVLFSVKSIREYKESSYQSTLNSLTQKYGDIQSLWIDPTSLDEIDAKQFNVSPAKLAFFKALYAKKYGKTTPPNNLTQSMLTRSVTDLVNQYE